MNSRKTRLVGGSLFAFSVILWNAWDFLTAVKDLPSDINWFVKFMADPPIFAPWLVLGASAVFLARTFWNESDVPIERGSQTSSGHTVTSNNQSGGITAGELHVHAEDRSLKRRLRILLAEADSRIPREIDAGTTTIETRMTGAQFAALEQLLQTDGSADLVSKADVTGRFVKSQMNNGTYGPTTAEALQIRVKFFFTQQMRD